MAQSGEPAEKKQKLDTESKFDFTDAAAVRGLAGHSERLVCLKLPGGLGSLYCHSCFLSFSSPVLRHAMDDTQPKEQQQQEDQLCTIPLAGDSDLSVWQLALGLIYRLDSAVITLANAQALLLLAHKYDMRRITADVEKFLLGEAWSGGTVLTGHFSPSTVGTWLAIASKCQLDKLVQPCIDYLVSENSPMDMQLLTSLEPSHAGKVLAALQQEIRDNKSKLGLARGQFHSAQADLGAANRKLGDIERHLGVEMHGPSPTGHTCHQCQRRWISIDEFDTCCEVVTTKVDLDEVDPYEGYY